MSAKSLVLAATLLGLGLPAAQAATVTFGPNDKTAFMDVATNVAKPDGVSFTWTKAPSSGWIEFTSSAAFALKLHFYGVGDRTPTSQQVSGYVFKVWDSVANAWSNLTTDTNNCAGASLAPVAGKCNMISSMGYTGSYAALQPPGEVGPYAAGRYLLGVYDSGQPSNASVEFQIAAVPLPATGLALIAGLGGLAALGARRRRTLA